MEKRKKYLAYGSNLHIRQMAARCPTAKVAGQGMAEGYGLLFCGSRSSAVATIEPQEGGQVPVLIWEIGRQDEINLDRYEGYPNLYIKKDIDVQTEAGTEKVMAYVMNEGYGAGLPSPYYLDIIREGYEKAGFDLAILEEAVEKSRQKLYEELEEGHLQEEEKESENRDAEDSWEEENSWEDEEPEPEWRQEF